MNGPLCVLTEITGTQCQMVSECQDVKILVIQAEERLNARIHELEMKLIRRGVFAWPEIDTPLSWAVAVWVACILFCRFVGVGSALVERKPGNVQPASQERPAETPAPRQNKRRVCAGLRRSCSTYFQIRRRVPS